MSANITQILFIDLETVPMAEKYADLNERFQKLWEKKHQTLYGNIPAYFPEQSFEDKGGIYAEFGKIIVAGIGFCFLKNNETHLKVKAIYGENEKELLLELCAVINKMESKQTIILCAHNGKEFDFPYLTRRLIANRLPLPNCLNITNKKPWEINHLDTMEMWKCGDRKSYTSLELLAAIFDIETSKSDIDGSQVSKVYYKEKDLVRIANYCVKDVEVLTQVYLVLNNLEEIKKENINRSLS